MAYSKARNPHLQSLLQRFNEIDIAAGLSLPNVRFDLLINLSNSKLIIFFPPFYFQFPTDVDPVFVSNESELKVIMADIERALSSDDWKIKVDAMTKLQGLVVGGCANMRGFATAVKGLEEPFQQQLRDLRSALIKETCTTISVRSIQPPAIIC